jgi:hypothetical protein
MLGHSPNWDSPCVKPWILVWSPLAFLLPHLGLYRGSLGLGATWSGSLQQTSRNPGHLLCSASRAPNPFLISIRPAPSDYVEPTSNQEVEKATIEVDGAFENCNEYITQFGYECVPYYQCSNGTIITDGAGLIDIRNGFGALDAEHSKCPGFLDVCCKDPDHVAPKPREPLYKPKCGRRNANGLQTRIQGFTHGESQFGEWPSMVAVLRTDNVAGEQVNLFQCGGSLIAPGVVLTAAHCVDKYR